MFSSSSVSTRTKDKSFLKMSAEDHKTIIDGVQVIWTPNAIENLKELIESTEVQQLNFQEMKLLTERFAIASARRLRRHTVKILYETLFISPRYLTNCLTVDLAIPIQRIAERVKHVQTPATSHSRIIQGFQLFRTLSTRAQSIR